MKHSNQKWNNSSDLNNTSHIPESSDGLGENAGEAQEVLGSRVTRKSQSCGCGGKHTKRK